MGGVARGSTANLAGAVVFGATNLVITLLVTHRIPQSEAGIFFSATSLFLLATTLGTLGSGTGMVYFIARSRAIGCTYAIRRYFRAGIQPVMILGCIMGFALFVFAPGIALRVNPDYPEHASIYLRVIAVFVPMTALANVSLAALRGLSTMRANVIVEQVGRSVLQVACIAIALIAPTSWGLGLAWAVPYVPAAIAAYCWWRRLSAQVASQVQQQEESRAISSADRLSESGSVRGEYWRFTAPRAIASVAQLAIQRLDIVLVAALAGAAEAAVYTAATRFLIIGQMGNRAISMAMQPRLAAALARKDHAASSHLYRMSTAWLMVLTWPLYITFVIFGTSLMTLFGSGYSGGSTVLLVLASTMLLATGCGMVDLVLTMGGRTSWNLANVLAGLGANVAIDLWLIPIYGVLGAAIGWAVAIALQNLLALSQTGLILRLHPFGRSSLVAACLSLCCFGAVGLAARQLMGTTWLALGSSLLVGGVCYIAGLWRWRGTLELSALRNIRRGRTKTTVASATRRSE